MNLAITLTVPIIPLLSVRERNAVMRISRLVWVALLSAASAAADEAQPYAIESWQAYASGAAVGTTDLLPASPDPGFLLSSPFDRTPQLGTAYAVSEGSFSDGLKSRIGGSVAASAAADTGAFTNNA
jgi:hypothetical protein